MQRDSGLRSILSRPEIYSRFQNLIGARKARKWVAKNFWKIPQGCKVVDIGCGPGDVLLDLPGDVEYLGFDPSQSYIERANQKFADRSSVHFLCGVENDFIDDARFRESDVVLCNCVLHHLEDVQVTRVLEFAKRVLRVDGRFLCAEPCELIHQPVFYKWMMSLDRGANIRSEDAWKMLVDSVLGNCQTSIATGLIRIPYAHILIRWVKETE